MKDMKDIKKATWKSVIKKSSVTLLLITFFCTGFSQPPEGILHKRPVNILVNQVGYQTGREKTVILQIYDSLQTKPGGVFYILNLTGDTVFKGNFLSRGKINEGIRGDWGARYWTGDFTSLNTPGEYQVRVQAEGKIYSSFNFRIGPDVIFKETIVPAFRWFWYQRCGFAVPGLHMACHLDDARIPDNMGGGYRSASGGWHNAGDFNKYASISCRSVYALTTLAREAKDLGLSDNIREQVTGEALWGAEFLYKMVLPGKGLIYEEVWNDYSYWGPPERETDNLTRTADDRPFRGISPSAMTSCALAATARLTGRNDFRKAAEELWKTAVDSLYIDREEIWTTTSGGGQPELENNKLARLIRRTADLLLADLELEVLTGDKRYFESAQLHAKSLIEYQNIEGSWVSDVYSRTVYQGIPPAALALYARAYPGTETSEKVLNALRLWVGYIQQITDNPFSLISWDRGVFFNPYILRPDQRHWWYTGQNSQYLSNAWALYLAAPLIRESDAIGIADCQLDWILGLNPYGICMMEGKGRLNIPNYHHRWAPSAGRGGVPGAIPNGFCRLHPDQDRPYMDMLGINYNTTEPWEPHNAFYILAVSARIENSK